GVVLVFGHAVAAHGHVAGQHLPDLLLDAALVHAQGVGAVVTHRPHGVVGHVAVQGAVARHGLELDVAHLADTDDLGDFAPPLRLRPAASITAGDLELHAVQVDGVVPHAQVADAQAHPFAAARHDRLDGGEDLGIEGPQVEILHHRRVRPTRARVQGEVVQQEGEFAVHVVAAARVDHQQAHHAQGQLHHLVHMRVVHVAAVLAQGELVGVGLARLDLRLRQAADAIHAAGQDQAVPVDGGRLGQVVGDEDAHAVAFHRLQGRAGRAAVVAPAGRLGAGSELVLDFLGDQVELLDAAVHAV